MFISSTHSHLSKIIKALVVEDTVANLDHMVHLSSVAVEEG